MKKLPSLIVILIFSARAYACLPNVTSPPILVQFNSFLIDQQYDGQKTQALVKTLLDIGEDGRVENYHIISVKPSSLNVHQVEVAVKKAKFSAPANHGNPVQVKDHIYTFEFEVGR
ncbi:energy transducer TonB [Microbulbifer variabilis]|uniref:energy transducer TonB n=1 Tax=Microbulbifer variabilis TaxID=266805 RepID=UPI001CFE2C78|nr:energy transducer TonB [Microbulbifer variabilis]